MENLWWKEYRKNKYKVRKRLNLETIARKSFKKNFKELLQHWSLSGARRLVDSTISIKRRLALFIIYCLVLVFFGYYLYSVWMGLSRPLLVTMESSTYPISSIDFPAVALCNINKISKRTVNDFAKLMVEEIRDKHKKHNETFDESQITIEHVAQVFMEMGRLQDFKYSETIENDPLAHFTNSDNFDTHKIIRIMNFLAPNCSDMLLKCAWQGNLFDCGELFEVRRTILGHCCTFNYNRLYKEDGRPSEETVEKHRQINPGKLTGLNVILDPQIDDYGYPIRHIRGFDVLLFDSQHYADFTAGGSVVHHFLEVDQLSMIQLQSTVQYASAEVRKYSIETVRQNWQHHDYNLT